MESIPKTSVANTLSAHDGAIMWRDDIRRGDLTPLISPAKPTVPSDSGNITEETVASNKDEGSNAVPTTAGTVDDRKGAAASNTVTDVNAGEKVPKSDLAQPNAKDMPLSRAITGEDDDWEILESVAEGPKEKLPEWMLIDFGWQLEVIWPGRRRCLPGVHSR